MPDPSSHLTEPFVTRLARAGSAPNSFAGETDVIGIGEQGQRPR